VVPIPTPGYIYTPMKNTTVSYKLVISPVFMKDNVHILVNIVRKNCFILESAPKNEVIENNVQKNNKIKIKSPTLTGKTQTI
jgi:hypothetical protein